MPNLRRLRHGALLLVLVLLGGCDRPAVVKFSGAAQGTTYHITIVDTDHRASAAALQQAVEARLTAIDKSLSSYRDDSELAAFNRAPVGEWQELGGDLYRVLRSSVQLSRESRGVFDITVAPLIDLWGFGATRPGEHAVPTEAAIERERALVGFDYLEIDTAAQRARKQRALRIDINGIAQGYSVDQLADVLREHGCRDFLVELGGELYAQGRNPSGESWRIGIEQPGDSIGEVQQAVRVSGVAITTAGDYHEYFESGGLRYSHTIDPRSGRPITHPLASVTVVARNATLADGYDTVLEVLGPEAGFEFAQRHGIAAFFIIRTPAGFVTRYTPAMSAYLPAGSR